MLFPSFSKNPKIFGIFQMIITQKATPITIVEQVKVEFTNFWKLLAPWTKYTPFIIKSIKYINKTTEFLSLNG